MRIDRIYSEEELASLPTLNQVFLRTYSTWYKEQRLWVLCGDNGRHFNHSSNPNTMSQGIAFGDDIALEDLAAGTELTSDYATICNAFTGEDQFNSPQPQALSSSPSASRVR